MSMTPEACPDDEVKRLKARANQFCLDSDAVEETIPLLSLRALLARLEAAEDLLESLLTIIPRNARSISMDQQEEAWRKAAGK